MPCKQQGIECGAFRKALSGDRLTPGSIGHSTMLCQLSPLFANPIYRRWPTSVPDVTVGLVPL